jgi:uncharacterized membrane protein
MNRVSLIQFARNVRASYWFLPSLMAVGAIGVALAMVWIDVQLTGDWQRKIPFLFYSQPDAARSLLATLAGSMITVAGVTFSLTLLAVSHATGQFGPRLLNNFMRDRGNQLTLGTFIATFLYCLIVLRTVRNAFEAPHSAESPETAVQAFVPHLSVAVAVLLAIFSVAVLIYFIHHVPESIRLSNVVSGVGRELVRQIERIFPEMIAEPRPDKDGWRTTADLPDRFREDSQPVVATKGGYIQAVDEEGLLHAAVDHDLIIWLTRKPGDFLCESLEMLRVRAAEPLTDKLSEKLRRLFAVGVHRSIEQNVMFAVDQLAEVAQRALSPGVCDPQTAMYSLDWLKRGMVRLMRRDQPRGYRYDRDGELRIVANPPGFADFCAAIFGQLNPYVATDRNAALHMMRILGELHGIADKSQARTLGHYARRLLVAAEQNGMPEFDIDELRKIAAQAGINE